MADDTAYAAPRWLRDLLRFLPLKSQFVLSGNVRDLQLQATASGPLPQPLVQYLVTQLRQRGYARVVTYDPAMGFGVAALPGEAATDLEAFLRELGLDPANGRASAGISLFAETMERLVTWPNEPVVLIADFASRLTVRQDALSPQEHQAFTRAVILSHKARPRPFGVPRRPFFNTVIWVVDKEGDLPDWLVIGNPRLRHVPIAKPDHHTRRALGRALIRTLDGAKVISPRRLKERFRISSTNRGAFAGRSDRHCAAGGGAGSGRENRRRGAPLQGGRDGRSLAEDRPRENADGGAFMRRRVKGQAMRSSTCLTS